MKLESMYFTLYHGRNYPDTHPKKGALLPKDIVIT